jgi:DGQHR domain-containing protein
MREFINDIPATPHFSFVYGQYKLSNWTIPYFATTMTLREAAANLKLAAELVGHQSDDWSLEELYQREVDWNRVDLKIMPYLEAPDKPKFFNSLTIALMPLNPKSSRFAPFANGDWTPPGMIKPDRFPRRENVGPFSLGFWSNFDKIGEKGSSTGEIRWNTRQVFAVAIDGQHRLAAIQRFAERHDRVGTVLDDTSVPVILLVLAGELGYQGAADGADVGVLRRLFIDLNKHAQSVSRARQILLDDADPISRCVRALIENRLTLGFGALEGGTPKLPLSLVDWHTEQAKFDDGPYVTTILGLDWIIAQCLKTKSIGDHTDYRAFRRQLLAFRSSLQLTLDHAAERLRIAETSTQAPFSYRDSEPQDELKEIVDAFGRIWSGPLIHLFSAFKPYSDLIALRKKNNSDTVEFVTWYSLRRKSDEAHNGGRAARDYQEYVNQLQVRLDGPIMELDLGRSLDELGKMKEDRGLAFNVAFQRSYILAFVEFNGITAAQLEELEEAEEDYDVDDILLFGEDDEVGDGEMAESGIEAERQDESGLLVRQQVQQYVSALNDVLVQWPEFLDVDVVIPGADEDQAFVPFWLGSLKKPDGGVDFTQGASKRAADLIFAIAAMHVYDGIIDPHQESSFDDFVESLMNDGNGFLPRVKRALIRMSRNSSSIGGRILQSGGWEFESSASREEIIMRLRYVWDKLGL